MTFEMKLKVTAQLQANGSVLSTLKVGQAKLWWLVDQVLIYFQLTMGFSECNTIIN